MTQTEVFAVQMTEPCGHRNWASRHLSCSTPGGNDTFCRSAIACFKFLERSLLPCRSVSCFFWSRRRMMWATSGSWYMSKARSSKGEMGSHLLGAEIKTQTHSCILAGLSCLFRFAQNYSTECNFHLSWTGQKTSHVGRSPGNCFEAFFYATKKESDLIIF